MPDGTTVTFALLCYNQADYIEAAVRAAFAQTHQPLQIILSDDGSRDESFAIMQVLAAEYRGPHRVVVRRNEPNLGLIGHVNRIAELAEGELIVVAGGDDISAPERTAVLWDEYVRRGRPALLHSKGRIIDAQGEPIGEVAPKPSLWRDIGVAEACLASTLYLGASGAWSRRLFEKYGPIDDPKTFEDLVLGFRAALEGGGAFVDRELLDYRVLEGGLSYDIAGDRLRVERLMIATLAQRRRDLARSGHPDAARLDRLLSRHLAAWRIAHAGHGGGERLAPLALRHPIRFVEFAIPVMLRRLGIGR